MSETALASGDKPQGQTRDQGANAPVREPTLEELINKRAEERVGVLRATLATDLAAQVGLLLEALLANSLFKWFFSAGTILALLSALAWAWASGELKNPFEGW